MKRNKKGKKGQGKKIIHEDLLQPMSVSERAFEQILQRERTLHPNSEGYHFIRPEWHRYVYGGAKKGDKG